ncbi:tetratricopeptide repeat protein [Chryseolinea sp. T2]|uniref:tetratricopeptide repeat protein n=1 Tax=Chryseolinea sp. T2 TaxID=3129255 RepID=UPI003077336C
MNHTDKDIELIEKYFDEDLSEYEMESFERRLKTDDIFRSLVEQEKYIIGAIRMQGLKDDLEQIKKIEAGLKDPIAPSGNIPGSRTWYLLAAAVVAIIIVARFALTSSVTTQDLYEDNFRPYPNVFQPAVRGQQQVDDRTEAFKAYNKSDFFRAATLFRAILERGNDPESLLLLGNCNLVLGNTDAAIANFSELNRTSPELSMQAKWFLALAYLKNGDESQATPLLQQIAATDASYADKAKSVLEKLE